MDDSESFHSRHRRHLSSSFSQLLFCNELDDHNPIGDDDQSFTYSTDSHFNVEKPPKMLRFGGEMGLFGSDKSGVTTCKDSSISAPLSASVTNRGSSSNKRKTRLEIPSPGGKTRVREGRREKLGDRITALQRLVSPFGKTDTASVLHESMGYIRFLQEQVQVLCSPYLQHQPVSRIKSHPDAYRVEYDFLTGGEAPHYNVEERGEEPRRNLRSRGLCLVPVECAVHVASSNGADYWSPGGMVNHVVSPGVNPN